MVRNVAAALVFASLALASRPAQAGPVELLAQVALHPTDPEVMAVRYENGGEGFFYTDDGGASWRMLCGTFIDPGLRETGYSAIAGDGTLLMGQFQGMWQGTDGGCTWSQVADFQGAWIPDITPHPTDPDVLFTVTARSGTGVLNGILRRDPDGTWSDIGTREEQLVTRLRVVDTPSGLRFYEVVIRGLRPEPIDEMGTTVPNYILRYSEDEGQSWEEYPFELTEGYTAFELQAVDPTQPDRLVGLINRAESDDTVIVSSDRGQTFTDYLTLAQFGGIALARDGRVWIGETVRESAPEAPHGLWHAEALDMPATKLTADFPVHCVAYQPATETLLVCQDRSFGRVDPASGDFEPWFEPVRLAEFLSCPGVDMAATCQAQVCTAFCGPGHYPQAPMCCAYQDESFCGPSVSAMEGNQSSCEATGAPDSGAAGNAADATVPDAGEDPKTDGDGCSCSALGSRRATDRPAAWLLALAFMAWRTRRRSRQR